jgi:hypothetical protein
MNRAEAAKINGAKSNGPKTEEGKAISSQNALHFGLNSSQVVLPGENAAEYEELFRQIRGSWNIATLLESDLASEMAAARWRLRRIPRMEQAAYQAALERVRNTAEAGTLTDEEFAARVMNEFTNGPEMKQVHRHETRLRRVWEKARLELVDQIQGRLIAEDRQRRELEAQEAAAKAAEMRDYYMSLPVKEVELPTLEDFLGKPRRSTKPKPSLVQNEPGATSEVGARAA